MSRWYGAIGAALGLLGVAAGAFGAHGLREVLRPERLANWHTAANYQLLHALALVAVGVLLMVRPSRAARVAGAAFTFGVVVFSGSLFTLAVTDVRALGAVTPFGGVALLIGWIALVVALKPPRSTP